MPHEVKVRDREMTARRRSKMAVLTPSMLKAAAVPVGGGGQRERVREWKPSVIFFWNFPLLGADNRGSGEKETQSEIRGLRGRGGRKGEGCSRMQTDCQNVNMRNEGADRGDRCYLRNRDGEIHR